MNKRWNFKNEFMYKTYTSRYGLMGAKGKLFEEHEWSATLAQGVAYRNSRFSRTLRAPHIYISVQLFFKNKCVWFSFQICHSLFTQKSLYLIWRLWWYYTAPYYPLSTITGLGVPKKNSLSEVSPPLSLRPFFLSSQYPSAFFNTSGNDCDITICV